MIFKKIRYLSVAYVSILISKIFFVDIPPVTSVTGVIKRDGKILCLNLSYYKGLGLPGGIINGNETAETALMREIKEETGMTVVDASFLGTVSAPFHGIASLSLVYSVEIAGEIKNSEEGTLLWLTPEELLPRLQYPNAQLAIKTFTL